MIAPCLAGLGGLKSPKTACHYLDVGAAWTPHPKSGGLGRRAAGSRTQIECGLIVEADVRSRRSALPRSIRDLRIFPSFEAARALQLAWILTTLSFFPAIVLGWTGPLRGFLVWSTLVLPLYIATWAWLNRGAPREGLYQLALAVLVWLAVGAIFLPSSAQSLARLLPSVVWLAWFTMGLLTPLVVPIFMLRLIESNRPPQWPL